MQDKVTIEKYSNERNCPFPGYARLRRDAPVWYDSAAEIWMVSRYEDVRTVLRDSQSFSASILGADDFEIRSPATGCPLPAERSLLGSDPPIHDRFRSIISPFFTEKALESYAALARSTLDEKMQAIGATGRCEVIEYLCLPTVASMIGQAFGLKPQNFFNVARWMRICGQSNARSRPPELQPAFEAMLKELWNAANEQGSHSNHGLLHALIELQMAGDLEDAQVLDFAVAILKGAADTTSYLVGNALVTWHEHPSIDETIRAQPERIADFIEESLRHDSPVQMSIRKTICDVDLSGTKISRGSRVLLLIGSANRDDAAFDDPENFHLDRSARRHLAFGSGPHRCPGADMARIQARMILEAILLRTHGLEIVRETMLPVDRTALRGFERLDIRFHRF